MARSPVGAGTAPKTRQSFGDLGKQAINDKNTFTVSRYDRKSDSVKNDTFKRGETASFFINKDTQVNRKITSITRKGKQTFINGHFSPGEVYKTAQPKAEKKKGVKLSVITGGLNKKNAPKGGFNESDRVPR